MTCIVYRAKTHKDIHITVHSQRHIHEKIEVLFIDQFAPMYKLIKNIIYHILGGYDVHDGLRCIIEVFD